MEKNNDRTNLIKMFRWNTNQLQFNFQRLVCFQNTLNEFNQQWRKNTQTLNKKKNGNDGQREGVVIYAHRSLMFKNAIYLHWRRHLVHEKLSISFSNQFERRKLGKTRFCSIFELFLLLFPGENMYFCFPFFLIHVESHSIESDSFLCI